MIQSGAVMHPTAVQGGIERVVAIHPEREKFPGEPFVLGVVRAGAALRGRGAQSVLPGGRPVQRMLRLRPQRRCTHHAGENRVPGVHARVSARRLLLFRGRHLRGG